jgi:hypothetical protein
MIKSKGRDGWGMWHAWEERASVLVEIHVGRRRNRKI